MKQEEYIEYIAEKNYLKFYELGHAVAGNNGPHGHKDTPVRNTAHYLIIYGYLYKKYEDKKYLDICKKFANYLCDIQNKSKSGAIECMVSDTFDHLNGLIGQGWAIEALLYYYEITKDKRCLGVAKSIFFSQKYDRELHLWHRVELDGRDIGIDTTFNHHVWFAACSFKLAKYCNNSSIDEMISDFLTNGCDRDFHIYDDGLLHHTVNLNISSMKKERIKRTIKYCLSPVKSLNPRKLDPKYIERAYHIFDIYGFCILNERYGHLPIFASMKYKQAMKFAMDINSYNANNGVFSYIKKGSPFNVFSYSYNSPAFEYPYISFVNGINDEAIFDKLYLIQKQLMADDSTGLFSKNNPDIETWNARTYEIIRYLEKVN